MIKTTTFIIIFIALIFPGAYAQLGIGTTTPHASSALDITANDKGLLIPRMNSMERDAIPSPALGLLIYNTDNQAFCYYNGNRWLTIKNSGINPESLTYTATTGSATNTHLISAIHNTVHTDSAGTIFDSGGEFFHYGNNDNFSFHFFANGAIGYKFTIDYNIAVDDTLMLTNPFTQKVIAVYTDATGTDTVYSNETTIRVSFKSNHTLTLHGFALTYHQIFDAGASGILPSVSGTWYYRPAAHAVAGGLKVIPESNMDMGYHSISYGYANAAKGSYSAAIGGYNNISTGMAAFATGNTTRAVGNNAFTSGMHTKAIGNNTLATGAYTQAIGDNSAAIGWGNTASGYTALATGRLTLASGTYAVSMGLNTIAKSYAAVAMGRYNDTTAASSTLWVATDPVLSVGNGTPISRSNALTLFKNGNMTIAGTLTQNSDARLKTNFQRLSGVMEKLQLLNGYQYNWNTHYADSKEQRAGLLAQEIESVMPELIRKDNNGVMSVNYMGIIPYLLEGVKTVQAELTTLQNRLKELQNEN